MNTPLVSVIVPTYQSAENIKLFLESFLFSTYKNFEIIINDDIRTIDNTAEIVSEYFKKGIQVQLIRENKSMAQARKAGAKYAKGEYLFHLDSDMRVTPELLAECVLLCSGGFDALVVPEVSIGTTFWAKCKWLEKKCYEGVEEMESLRFVKKEIYDNVGGHNEEMIFSEDKDFDIRVREKGYRVGRTTNFLYHNEGELYLVKTLKKKLGYSKTANIFAEQHPEHFRWQANIFNRYIIYIRNIKYLFIHPLLFIGMIFMKTCEFGVGGISYFLGMKS